MAVTQLRRYVVDPEGFAGWIEHWRQNVAPLREQYGFRVRFAFADHDNSQFVWAIDYDGSPEEFAARDAEYHGSSEWKARNDGKNGPLQSVTVSLIDTVHPIT